MVKVGKEHRKGDKASKTPVNKTQGLGGEPVL